MSQLAIIGLGALGLGLAQIYRPQSNLLLVGKPDQVLQLINHYQICSLQELTLKDHSTILICTQAFSIASVLIALQQKLNESHSVILLCNGLGVYAEALEFVPQKMLVRGSVSTGFLKVDATQIRQFGRLKVELAGDFETLRRPCHEFESCSAQVTIVRSPQLLEWRKVIVNAVVNSLCTIANVKNGALISDPKLNQKARKLLSEVQAVAVRACAEFLPISDKEFFNGLLSYSENINSTLAAQRLNRQTESDYLLGAVVNAARHNGLNFHCMEEVWQQLVSLHNA